VYSLTGSPRLSLAFSLYLPEPAAIRRPRAPGLSSIASWDRDMQKASAEGVAVGGNGDHSLWQDTVPSLIRRQAESGEQNAVLCSRNKFVGLFPASGGRPAPHCTQQNGISCRYFEGCRLVHPRDFSSPRPSRTSVSARRYVPCAGVAEARRGGADAVSPSMVHLRDTAMVVAPIVEIVLRLEEVVLLQPPPFARHSGGSS